MQPENSTCTDFHEHERTQHDSITVHVHTRTRLDAAVEAAVQELAVCARYRRAGNSGDPDGSGDCHRKPRPRCSLRHELRTNYLVIREGDKSNQPYGCIAFSDEPPSNTATLGITHENWNL